MKKIALILAALLPVKVIAQDLNPTVEVTNAYEEPSLAATKPAQKMAVPDSLLNFRLGFDYSVTDAPYKGAYNFEPYSIDFRPDDSLNGEKELFVKVGAGYSFHPSLDVAWQAVRNPRFRMNLYASHHSYFGKYRRLYASLKGEDQYRIKRDGKSKYAGHDSYTIAGVNAHADYDRFGLYFNLGYYGIHVRDYSLKTGYNAFDANFLIQSHDERSTHLYYRAGIDFRYAREGLGGEGLNDAEVVFKGSFGPVIGGVSKVLVCFEAEGTYYTSLFKSTSGIFALIPKYSLQTGRLNLDLGVRFAGMSSSDHLWEGFRPNACEGQFVFPEASLSLDVVKSSLNLFAGATGGYDHNSYSSIKSSRHFFNPYYAMGTCAVLNNSIDRLHFYGGLRGSAGSRFAYELRAGHRNVKNGLLDAVYTDGTQLYPGISYKDYNLFYLDMGLRWESRTLFVDALLSYSSCNVWKKYLSAFEPAQLRGVLNARYTLRDKYFIGLGIEGCARRRGAMQDISGSSSDPEAVIPAWTNVSLDFQYRYNGRLSFWADVDNLLDMTIQRTAMVPDSGLSITAGICFSL